MDNVLKTYSVKFSPISAPEEVTEIPNVFADGFCDKAAVRWFLDAGFVRHEVAIEGVHFQLSKERGPIDRVEKIMTMAEQGKQAKPRPKLRVHRNDSKND